MCFVANPQVVPPVAWVQERELLEQIERSALRDSPEGGDQKLAHFVFINREYFRSAETQKFPHTYIFIYLHWQNNVGNSDILCICRIRDFSNTALETNENFPTAGLW
jgi:hypothetical protein